jgi:hypothetical protein
LERKLTSHDKSIAGIVETIRQMVSIPDSKRDQIGFVRSRHGK